jgi:hypothetical protein
MRHYVTKIFTKFCFTIYKLFFQIFLISYWMTNWGRNWWIMSSWFSLVGNIHCTCSYTVPPTLKDTTWNVFKPTCTWIPPTFSPNGGLLLQCFFTVSATLFGFNTYTSIFFASTLYQKYQFVPEWSKSKTNQLAVESLHNMDHRNVWVMNLLLRKDYSHLPWMPLFVRKCKSPGACICQRLKW